MRVFISWSGERSAAIAQRLKDWLPDVVRSAEPWVSKDDLRKGRTWVPELVRSLRESQAGLVVVTHENAREPWPAFEAGAIAVAIQEKPLCPIYCGLRPADLAGPLSEFQGVEIGEKAQMYDLARDLNALGPEPRPDEIRLRKWFEDRWPDLSKAVAETLSLPAGQQKRAPSHAEETLELVRQIASQQAQFLQEIKEQEERRRARQQSRFAASLDFGALIREYLAGANPDEDLKAYVRRQRLHPPKSDRSPEDPPQER